MKEHDIQIEALELKNKNDKIVVFTGELKGHRSTIRGKQANYAFYWSPIWLLLCPGRTKKHMRGQLNLYNVNELETMATAENLMATDMDWDPTGR